MTHAMPLRFTTESLFTIATVLRARLRDGPVHFEVPSPDVSAVHYPGERIELSGQPAVYRPFRTWCDLAESLMAAILTPVALPDGWVQLCFRPLDRSRDWSTGAPASGQTEKYGVQSTYARTAKGETASFLMSYLEALDFVGFRERLRVLCVGVSRGDELQLLVDALGDDPRWAERSLVGVDHCASALQEARRRLPAPVFSFLEGDLRDLDACALGTFDLLIAINTLHSPALNGHAVFQALVRDHLAPDGAVILGVPNSRYVDHTLLYGAPMRNFSTPDLSVLWKKVGFFRRYLHQHGFRVRLLGQHTVLVVGRRGGTARTR